MPRRVGSIKAFSADLRGQVCVFSTFTYREFSSGNGLVGAVIMESLVSWVLRTLLGAGGEMIMGGAGISPGFADGSWPSLLAFPEQVKETSFSTLNLLQGSIMASLKYIVAGLGLASSVGAACQDLTPTVTVKNGTYSGLYSPYYHQDFFLGIPFAQVREDLRRASISLKTAAKHVGP
jgi:hypothetical protein